MKHSKERHHYSFIFFLVAFFNFALSYFSILYSCQFHLPWREAPACFTSFAAPEMSVVFLSCYLGCFCSRAESSSKRWFLLPSVPTNTGNWGTFIIAFPCYCKFLLHLTMNLNQILTMHYSESWNVSTSPTYGQSDLLQTSFSVLNEGTTHLTQDPPTDLIEQGSFAIFASNITNVLTVHAFFRAFYDKGIYTSETGKGAKV